MALLFFDGFEGLSSSTVAATAASEVAQRGYSVLLNSVFTHQTGGNVPSPLAPNGQFLWTRMSWASGAPNFEKGVPGSPTTVICGYRVWFQMSGDGAFSSIADNGHLRLVDSSGNVHLSFRVLADGSISVRRGADNTTVLGTSATELVATTTWTYVEFKATIDDTDGGVWVRVNGADALRLGAFAVSPTTLDTRNGGTAEVAKLTWCFQSHAFSDVTHFGLDDLYILDTTGSAPYNDFLGPVRVLELLPDAAGASAQFTPSAGTNHEAVDDALIHDGDTTYVESGTAGHRDLHNLTTAAVSSVLAVKTIAVARRTDAGPTELELSVRSGSTTGDSTGKVLSDTYGEHAETFLTNPDTTNPWQASELTGLQAGIKIPT